VLSTMRTAIFLALTFTGSGLFSIDGAAASVVPIPPNPPSVPAAPASPGFQDSITPAAFPASRYAQLREKSPFAVATVPELPKAPERTFADGWKINSAIRFSENGRTIDVVSIKTADNQTVSLETDKQTKDGVSLVKVEWSSVLGKSVAW